jgi:hypothetical protein
MTLLADQFNKLIQVETDWDADQIQPEDVAVRLAIYKEQNKVAFKMADFFLVGGKFGNQTVLEEGIKKFIGKRRLLKAPQKQLYDRTANRGKEENLS